MINRYKFPRVDVSQSTRVISTPTATTPDVVPILVPIMSPIGPHGKIVRISSLTEYYDNFGVPSYDDMGLSAILIMRWLNQNGTVYVYRMVDETKDESKFEHKNIISFDAKYKGNKYNNIVLTIDRRVSEEEGVDDRYDVTIVLDGVETSLVGNKRIVEEFNNLTERNIEEIISISSNLIKNFTITGELKNAFTSEDGEDSVDKIEMRATTNYQDTSDGYYKRYKALFDLDSNNKKTPFYESLMSTNKTPIDLIVDVGFPDDLKAALYKAGANILEETKRGLFIAFSTYVFDINPIGSVPEKSNVIEGYNSAVGDDVKLKYTTTDSEEPGYVEDAYKIGWFAVLDQYLTLTDNIFRNREMYAPLTIPFALNVLFNTRNHSAHRPTAGTTYGRLTNYKNLSGGGPSVTEKDELFRARINYAEQDGDNIYIMTNRTFAHKDSLHKQTPLDFINNVRVKNIIMRDLQNIMKKYLYEYADGDTLLRCYTECNTYLNMWINNKALTSAEVFITLDPETEEYMYATLTIKFRGTIEYISVRLMID